MKQKLKVKAGVKKAFFDVDVPLTALKVSLYGSSLDEFDGKAIKLDLSKSLRGKNLELKMKVKKEDNKLKAEPVSMALIGSFIRKTMRRGTDYVEDSFDAECRDYIVKIKPFMITRMRVSRAIRKAIRDNARKYLLSYLKLRTSKEIFSEIITNKIQKGMAIKLKKIYPLALCEIRVFELKKEKSPEEKTKQETEKQDEAEERA